MHAYWKSNARLDFDGLELHALFSEGVYKPLLLLIPEDTDYTRAGSFQPYDFYHTHSYGPTKDRHTLFLLWSMGVLGILSRSCLSTSLDAIRQMVKYSKPDEATMVSFDSKMDRLFKECRGQRNFYITGFSLFLIL
jgi:hypothetical protein